MHADTLIKIWVFEFWFIDGILKMCTTFSFATQGLYFKLIHILNNSEPLDDILEHKNLSLKQTGPNLEVFSSLQGSSTVEGQTSFDFGLISKSDVFSPEKLCKRRVSSTSS